jgi:hypothetical protein
MAVSIKKIVLWRKGVENKPGVLAGALASLARAGADLQVVMAYRYPGEKSQAAIELYPVTAKRSVAAAREAGLTASSIPVLLVAGDNSPGLGHGISQGIADAGINIDFFVGQVVGRKYSVVLGFESEADATKAIALVRKAAAAKKR